MQNAKRFGLLILCAVASASIGCAEGPDALDEAELNNGLGSQPPAATAQDATVSPSTPSTGTPDASVGTGYTYPDASSGSSYDTPDASGNNASGGGTGGDPLTGIIDTIGGLFGLGKDAGTP